MTVYNVTVVQLLMVESVNDNHSLYVLSKHICTVVDSYFKEQWSVTLTEHRECLSVNS